MIHSHPSVAHAATNPHGGDGGAEQPADAWEALIGVCEAREEFAAQNWADRAKTYAIHDRILVGLRGVAQFHPATASAAALLGWAWASARDDRDAVAISAALSMLLIIAVRMRLRAGVGLSVAHPSGFPAAAKH